MAQHIAVFQSMVPDSAFFDDENQFTLLTDQRTKVGVKKALRVMTILESWLSMALPAELFGDDILLGQNMGQNRLRAMLLYCEGRAGETFWTVANAGKEWALEADLKREKWLLSNGSVDPEVVAIVRSAIIDTGNGIEIISPFDDPNVKAEDERRRLPIQEDRKKEIEEGLRREGWERTQTRLSDGREVNLADAMNVVDELLFKIEWRDLDARRQIYRELLLYCAGNQMEVCAEVAGFLESLKEDGRIPPMSLAVLACAIQGYPDRPELANPFSEPIGQSAFSQACDEDREARMKMHAQTEKQEKERGEGRQL